MPDAGWSGPDSRGIVRFTAHGPRAAMNPPDKEGYERFFVSVHGDRYTTWAYRPRNA